MVEKNSSTRALSSRRIEAARREDFVASSATATAGIHTDIAPTSQGLGAGEEDFLSTEEGEEITPLDSQKSTADVAKSADTPDVSSIVAMPGE
ncbi:hypothetical protein PtA15_6A531 [Puccinia triticina]|uniref:Uncharacterized protein n=1 Tax=Puccinia triticina TaxID=208348 RepID=A0ABY7CT48_9BASI|nr:uncharacterized protein PtA15_6A531 [Puccinia triticina]WAQ85902.1 hypothetical protein PtA15_6A531 [Puccinia triticina]WAR55796.1 hypothetical protein PtB15_6B539 [Puccinia triticina]